MAEQHQTVLSSPQRHMQARVCPRGHVYLHVGHTCISLRKEECLALAQIVHATAQHLQENPVPWQQGEQKH
jgi:hypothetical protein